MARARRVAVAGLVLGGALARVGPRIAARGRERTLQGSFSAVAKPISATKYSLGLVGKLSPRSTQRTPLHSFGILSKDTNE